MIAANVTAAAGGVMVAGPAAAVEPELVAVAGPTAAFDAAAAVESFVASPRSMPMVVGRADHHRDEFLPPLLPAVAPDAFPEATAPAAATDLAAVQFAAVIDPAGPAVTDPVAPAVFPEATAPAPAVTPVATAPDPAVTDLEPDPVVLAVPELVEPAPTAAAAAPSPPQPPATDSNSQDCYSHPDWCECHS